MPQFKAIYRDHVSDRNPVREEVTFLAVDLHAAVLAAQKRATRNLKLIDVIPVGEGSKSPRSGGHR